MSYLAHLEYSPGGKKLSADVPRNNDAANGSLLFARYDLARIRREVKPEAIACGPSSLWRYAPLLPASNPGNAVTLGLSEHLAETLN